MLIHLRHNEVLRGNLSVPVTVFVVIHYFLVLYYPKGQYFIHENNNENRQKIFHS